jgi:hypothetical protein
MKKILTSNNLRKLGLKNVTKSFFCSSLSNWGQAKFRWNGDMKFMHWIILTDTANSFIFLTFFSKHTY